MSTEPEEVSGEQLRIKVAELCPTIANIRQWHPDRPIEITWKGSQKPFDPTRDLNACHEFEKLMTPEQLKEYNWELRAIVAPGWTMLATAKQRCQAFVATMEGK